MMDMSKPINLKMIENGVKCWFIRTEGGILYSEYTRKEYISLGWNYISRKKMENRKQNDGKIMSALIDEYKEKKNQLTKVFNKCKMFTFDMKSGDYIILPNKGSTRYTIGVLDHYYEIDKGDNIAEELAAVIFMKDSKQDSIDDSPYSKRWAFKKIAELSWSDIHPSLFISLRNPSSISNLTENKDLFFSSIYPVFYMDNNLYFNFIVKKKGNIPATDINEFTYNITKYFSNELSESNETLKQKISVSSSGPIIYFLENIILNQESWLVAMLLLSNLFKALSGGSTKINPITGEIDLQNNSLLDKVAEFRLKWLEGDKRKVEIEAQKIENKKLRHDVNRMIENEKIKELEDAGYMVLPANSEILLEELAKKSKLLEVDRKRTLDALDIR